VGNPLLEAQEIARGESGRSLEVTMGLDHTGVAIPRSLNQLRANPVRELDVVVALEVEASSGNEEEVTNPEAPIVAIRLGEEKGYLLNIATQVLAEAQIIVVIDLNSPIHQFNSLRR
jgi:hypothetical protein